MTLKTYQASCHCGRVRIELDLDLAAGTQRCNCSFCAKHRNWFAFVPAAQMRIIDGEATQTEYQWVPPGRPHAFLHHFFCATCGSRTYAWGEHESMGGKFYAMNLALLDDASNDELAQAPITYRDGRIDRFDQPPADTRLL
ncbi:GFA family protein [Lysobacter sp. K5869]|uniref:GFA family protein n=1 Tax=Lysobacter sp. K5869 TaxID=2820808 RepID=UPI001C0604C8|nr:GFA family protein [Lysobacter sp. K5869]QWP75848.1 GFA family protein [Lysobacter sp. K5869]